MKKIIQRIGAMFSTVKAALSRPGKDQTSRHIVPAGRVQAPRHDSPRGRRSQTKGR